MAYPSVTYSFTNGTTADATQVNQNFTDLINGLSDGTKDLSVKNIGASGKITVTETTDSTSGSTGSINTLGGLGVTKAIYCGSSITCVTSVISPLYTASAAIEVRSVTTLALNAGTSFSMNVANATTPVSAATCSSAGAWNFPVNTTHTFGGLIDAQKGLTVSGGSAAANTVIKVSNVLTMCGGSSGWALATSAGVSELSSNGTTVTSALAVQLGASTDTPYTTYHTIYKNLHSGTPSTNTDLYGGWSIGANTYNGAAGRAPTRLQGLTGTRIHFFPRTSDTAATGVIYVNQFNDAADGSVDEAASWTAAGAFTVGPAAGTTAGYWRGKLTAWRSGGNSPLAVSTTAVEAGLQGYVDFIENASDETGGSSAGGIRRNAGDTAYEFYNASDARLKDIKGEFTGGLDIVRGIPVSRYSWKNDEKHSHFGFIADHVETMLPSCVSVNEEGLKMLGTSDMTPVMWNAIRELAAENDSLKARIAALEAA